MNWRSTVVATAAEVSICSVAVGGQGDGIGGSADVELDVLVKLVLGVELYVGNDGVLESGGANGDLVAAGAESGKAVLAPWRRFGGDDSVGAEIGGGDGGARYDSPTGVGDEAVDATAFALGQSTVRKTSSE